MKYNIIKYIGLLIILITIRLKFDINFTGIEWAMFCLAFFMISFETKED